jgi:hypothetical protein
MSQDSGPAARSFSTGAVLTMMSGRMLCDLDELYDIASHLAGESVMTHQLPRVCDESTEPLANQFPELVNVEIPADLKGETAVRSWLVGFHLEYGDTRMVEPLKPEDHTYIHPLEEARMQRPDALILSVDPETGTVEEL